MLKTCWWRLIFTTASWQTSLGCTEETILGRKALMCRCFSFIFQSSETKRTKVLFNFHVWWCLCGYHSWIHHFIGDKPVCARDGDWGDGGCSLNNGTKKEREREGGGRDKTGGERMGEKADGCFWAPSPSSLFSPRWTTPMSNTINNIPVALPHTNLPAHTDASAVSSFIHPFFCHLIKFSCDQTATDVILLPPCFYYLCQTRSTRTLTSPSTFILKLVFWGPKGQGGTMRNQNRERTSVWCYVVFKVARRHVLLVPMPHQMFPL